MAFETKVILALLAELLVNAKSTKAAYEALRRTANVEGMDLPSYEEAKQILEDSEK